MALPTKARSWVVRNSPTDNVVLEGENATFEIQEKELGDLKEGQVLVQLQYLSNDPAQRGWIDANIDKERLYMEPVLQGDAMKALGIQKVIDSKDPKYPVGSLIRGFATWSDYSILDASAVQPVRDIPGIAITQQLGALGLTGLTALAGLTKIGRAKAGETIVVSGAAGATGSMAVQIAKNVIGCKKVIGLAGTDEKCRWVESIGADVCINYKKDWKPELKKATEGFVNMYFDNVGGEQLDFMLTRLGMNGRVIACGAIADYNKGEKTGLQNWQEVFLQRLEIKGFIVTDYMSEFPQMLGELAGAAKAGKIKASDENETVVETKFEDIPKTWTKLFSGENRGKLVSKTV